MTENQNKGSGGGGGCGIGLGPLLLLIGGIMYGVCKNAATMGTCGGNVDIANVGFILMMVGVGICALAILILIVLCCLSAIFLSNN